MSITALVPKVTFGGVEIAGDATVDLKVVVTDLAGAASIQRMWGGRGIRNNNWTTVKRRVQISGEGVDRPDFTGVDFADVVQLTIPFRYEETVTYNLICEAEPVVTVTHGKGKVSWTWVGEEY